LINGTVRIPVPVAVAAALLFGVWVYTQQPATSNMPVPPIARVLKPAAVADAPALAGFQPVTTVEVQVIKESR